MKCASSSLDRVRPADLSVIAHGLGSPWPNPKVYMELDKGRRAYCWNVFQKQVSYFG